MQKVNNYFVHKFGGSSLANAERFKAVKSLLNGKDEIIVVSAIKNVTSLLQTLLDSAKEKRCYLSHLNELKQLHLSLIDALFPESKHQELLLQIANDINEIETIVETVKFMGSYSTEIEELILGYGEQWSARILSSYLCESGSVLYLDAATVLFIHNKNNMIGIDWSRSQAALDHFLKNKHFNQIVITGFIAATTEGRRTILGRNGSDFSAAIFAKLFKATGLTIWKDVDGIYSAHPEKVNSAFTVKSMSYLEALELAYFGAKVLHPKTIGPVMEHKIPIFIRNSLKPDAQGTKISDIPDKSPGPVRGLSSIEDITLINIEGTGMMGVSGIAARIFQILHQVNISVILISQGSSEHSICFAIHKIHADEAIKVLNENLQYEINQRQIGRIYSDNNCAILAVVGDGMVGTIGIARKLCHTLAKANINIRAIAQGSSERNISVVVTKEVINKALRAVHSGFYFANKTISIGLIGPGLIGRTLMQQIHAAQQRLNDKYQVNLCLRGIMNSKKMLLKHDAIDLHNWFESFENSSISANLNDFIEHIQADDFPHAVIIDCTADQNIAKNYDDFISKGVHIITPNKHANSGDILYYKALKALLEQKKSHYLYEATVCAGLPVINTLQDIIKTGDEVIAIEGILSGTLSFIFNEVSKGKTFSDAVIAAKQCGYTEPDPREDLSGMDVARKLVCLAREIGHDISLENVNVQNLIPNELKSCSLKEFLNKLPDYDIQMENLIADIHAKDENLCYMGSVRKDGSVRVSIESFSQTHPFSRLKGTDNLIAFYTKRYREQPLIIQGPGAGAEVTAAGVFADLLRLLAYLA
jgi:bifunctional aspartokinase / homoserine dehydrogenase 1